MSKPEICRNLHFCFETEQDDQYNFEMNLIFHASTLLKKKLSGGTKKFHATYPIEEVKQKRVKSFEPINNGAKLSCEHSH